MTHRISLVLLMTCWVTAISHAAEIHVPADHATIQEAIDFAVNGDEVIIADGTYTGLGNKDLDFGGKAITVRSASRDPAMCIIDCEDDGRGFYFHSGEEADSVVDGLTITNGDSYGGGGVSCSSSDPTLTNCRIEGNSTAWGYGFNGGGVYCFRSSPTLIDCTIVGNWTDGDGGGIYCLESSPTLIDCTITDNEFGGYWCYGGGLYCGSNSSPTLINCAIADNRGWEGGDGGGIYCDSSDPTFTDCTITGNYAGYRGDCGGIYCLESSPTLTNCTIAGNRSTTGYGGGIYCDSSSPTLIDCAIIGNMAGIYGGGVYGDSSSPTLTNCTIEGNTSEYGGGVAFPVGLGGRPMFNNCTITGNIAENSGGGIYCSNWDGMELSNCVVNQNEAGRYGGGMSNGQNNNVSALVTNCIFSKNTAGLAGGGMNNGLNGSVVMTNCVFWNNSAVSGDEISHYTNATLIISYSDIEGCGGSGARWDGDIGTDGGGNIDLDPLFVDPDNKDYHLGGGSPCIDAGDNTVVSEMFDLDGNPRFVDDPHTPDTGNGTPPIVDMGAYEFQGISACLSLAVDNLMAGEQAVFTIKGGTPGAKAVTVFGLTAGETVVSGMGGYCASFGIHGVGLSSVLGGLNRTFDANGEITFNQFVPNRAIGLELLFQSAEHGTCPRECMSNLVVGTVE